MRQHLVRVFFLGLSVVAVTGHGTGASADTDPHGYIFIDCGAKENMTADGVVMAAGGLEYNITGSNITDVANITKEDAPYLNDTERSIRVFTPRGGGCYFVPVVSTINTVRLGFAYYNYDKKNNTPSFIVTVGGMIVDQVGLFVWEWPQAQGMDQLSSAWGMGAGHAHYTEYTRGFPDGLLSVCLVGTGETSPPVLSSLEIIPVEDGSYTDEFSAKGWWKQWTTGGIALALKQRVNLGGPAVGPGVDQDARRRKWHALPDSEDFNEIIHQKMGHKVVEGSGPLLGGTGHPDEFPARMFNTAWEGNFTNSHGRTVLSFPLDFYPLSTQNLLLARLFVCELRDGVRRGQRVFNISFAWTEPSMRDMGYEAPLPATPWYPQSVDYDIVNATRNALVGTYVWQVGCPATPLRGGSRLTLYVYLEGGSELPPLLSGVELYEIVPATYVPLSCDPPNPSPPQLPPSPPSPAQATVPTGSQGSPSSNSSKDSESSGLSGGAIAGLVIGIVAAVVVLMGVASLMLRRTPKATDFHTFRGSDDVGLTSA